MIIGRKYDMEFVGILFLNLPEWLIR